MNEEENIPEAEELPSNDLTQNMEIHKHPHHVTHRKKWGEYFLEFLMLFLAVFLGFVAENLREHFVEKEREKQYMVSLVSDLQNDTTNLNAGFPLKEQRLNAIDSVFLFFKTNPDAKVIPGSVYREIRRANWDRHYRRNSTTIDQLKNAGGLRLVRKKIVADSIAALDLQWTRMEFYREAYITLQNTGMSMNEKIFNANDLLQKYIDNNTGTSMTPAMTDSLTIRINTQYLNEYLNYLNHQKVNTIQDEQNYKKLEKSTEWLISLIKKEYNL